MKNTPKHPIVIRIILVGITGRAQWVFKWATPERGFQIVGLCDVNTDAMETQRTALGLAADGVGTDLATVIQSVGADALIICTPTRFHVPMAILGLDAGLAVLTEKGMAPDWVSAKRLVAHVRDCNGKLCVAQNYRYSSLNQTLGAIVHGQHPVFKTGKVYHADLIQHRVRPAPNTLNYPFASVWDMSCHHFDNLLFWLGPVSAMTAQAYGAPWSAYGHPNNTTAHIEFTSGARVNYFHGHDSSRALYHLGVHGESGALLTDEYKIEFSERPLEQFGGRPVQEVPVPEALPSEVGVLADFYRYVVEDHEPGISGNNNLEVMAMCQMMVRSVSEQRRITRDELD